MKQNSLLIITNFLIGIIAIILFFDNAYGRPFYTPVRILAIFLIVINCIFYYFKYTKNTSTLFSFNGIIMGIMILLNPHIGNLIAGIELILSCILKSFTLFQKKA